MFKNMKLRTKISLGFGCVLFLMVLSIFFGYQALNGSSSGFTQYREMARDSNLVGQLQANMLMVRMNVKDFIITGSEKDQQEYQQYIDKMTEFLTEAQTNIIDPEQAKKIDTIDEEIKTYQTAFQKVVNYRKQRDSILYDTLNVKGPFMEQTLSQIMDSAEQENDMAAAYHSGVAMKHLLLARLYVVKFLDTNAQAEVDRVQQEFTKMDASLSTLDRELQNPQRRQKLASILQEKTEYIAAFNILKQTIFERDKIIQNTLDRIGPVIAKETEDVKFDFMSVQDQLGPKLVASNSNAILLLFIVGGIAIIIGVMITIAITRAIVRSGDKSDGIRADCRGWRFDPAN